MNNYFIRQFVNISVIIYIILTLFIYTKLLYTHRKDMSEQDITPSTTSPVISNKDYYDYLNSILCVKKSV